MMNSDDIEVAIEMIELSLSGNQPYETMTANKIHWLTVDDGVAAPHEFVDSDDTIELQQQRIRLFQVTYKVEEESFLQ